MQPWLQSSSGNAVRAQWVLLAYRLPREPSTPRTALWRKLRSLGVAQLLDGLAALPLDARSREQFEWLADQVIEDGGEATVWVAELAGHAQEHDLMERMVEAIAVEYRAVIAQVDRSLGEPRGQRRRSLGRLRRELRRIRARDYFPPEERELARQAVDMLSTLAEEVVA